MFDFDLLAGDRKTVLSETNNVVLTPALAQKYFDTNDWSKVIGNSISIDQKVYKITGVIANAPGNSHMQYTAIGNIEATPQGRDRTWDNMNLSTYVLASEGATGDIIVAKIIEAFKKPIASYERIKTQGTTTAPFATPLTDIHVHTDIQ